MPNLFEFGWFRSHSGLQLPWKFDADALTNADVEAIARIIRSKFVFGEVLGVPKGGLRLMEALSPFAEPGWPLLIVDDVLTTGRSMIEYREALCSNTYPVNGVVILARGPCPNWVWPILSVNEWSQARGTGLG